MRTDLEPSLSLDEVAARLRSTRRRIRALIEDGDLRFVPTTDIDDIRVPASALDELREHDLLDRL
jgi:excisionase family DNA binding protein